MELVIGLLVIAVVGYFVFFRNKEEPVPTTQKEDNAPYKVETPVPAQDVAPQPTVVVESVGTVEPPATPVVAEAPAKAPRKPRTPKAETVAKKPAAKKAAPKKVAAIKAKPKATTSKKA